MSNFFANPQTAIIDYAAEHGYTLADAVAAFDLYRDDPEYYNERGLPTLLRHAAPEAARTPQAYTVRV